MAVNVVMGVDISGFNNGINQGKNILKGLNAEMKAADAAFKATGNAEQQLTAKTKTLTSQLQVQKGIADQAEQAMQKLAAAGIAPTNAEYQRLYATMMNAQAGMNEAQAELNALSSSAQDTAASADNLNSSLENIGKKVSLDQVRSGIQSITDGLENAAKKALDLGKKLFDVIMDTAAQADDISTMATRLGLTDTDVQKMNYVADAFEAPVEQMAKTWKKVKMNMTSDSDEIVAGFEQLGVATHEIFEGKFGSVQGEARDYIDVFWEVGEALMNVKDASEQERLAQKLLGRSWDEMIPLFTKGREAYEAALEAAPAASEDAVESAAALNDRVKELEKSWDTLKLEVIGAVAPALEKGADALAKVLDQLTTYLQSEDGQKLLEGLGTAVTNLFDDLGNINAEDLANNVTTVITCLTDGLLWLDNNWESVKDGLIGIVAAWGALEVAGGILDIVKIVGGLKDMAGISAAGSAAGSAWGGAFASAVAAAAPWLIGLYTLLNPAGSAGNNIDTLYQNGQITEAGMEYWNNNIDQWYARQMAVGNRYGDLGTLMGNVDALQIMLDPTIDDEEVFKKLEDTLGLTPVDVNANVVVPGDTAAQISEQVGTVVINGVVHFVDADGNNIGVDFSEKGTPTGTKRKRPSTLPGDHANGLAYVPYDGYLARLHKGERVMTAREVQSRSYNSNLYVESMIMNNGTDAAGLASAMAAAQQRTMSGFGSR